MRTGRTSAASRAAAGRASAGTHAAVGVVLPAVLAVEDDADERRGRLLPARLADAVQLAEESRPRRSGSAALVVEADQVAQRVIAEDDAAARRPPSRPARAGRAAPGCGHGPAVAADLAVGRAPRISSSVAIQLDAVLGQQRHHRLADRPLARPHAARPLPKSCSCARPPAGRGPGVLGIAVAMRGRLTSGIASRASFLSSSSGRIGMVKRRRRQLDLAALGQLAVQRDDLAQESRCLSSSTVLSSSV